MGFLSIEPGPIFRQTYSRHTSASPDKRGVWTHSGLDACCPKCRKQPSPSNTVRQSDNQEGKMIRLPRCHFPPQEIPSIVVFKAGYESVPSNENPSMSQKNPVYHNRQKTFLKDGTAVKQRSAFVDPANPSAYQIPHQRRAKRASPAVYHLYLPREGRQPVVKSTLGLSKPPKHKYPPKKEASEKFPRLLFI